MIETIIHQEYQHKLQQLKQTLTSEQETLFDEWFDTALTLISYSAIDYKTTGFKEGFNVAFDLMQLGKEL